MGKSSSKIFRRYKREKHAHKVILNEDQHQQFFDTEDELVQYFLHQLCKNNDQIILDRPHELGNVIAGLNQSIPVIVVLHSTHLADTGNGIKVFIKQCLII